MKKIINYVLITIGIIGFIVLADDLYIETNLDNALLYIKKIIFTNDGTPYGEKKVVIDGQNGDLKMSGDIKSYGDVVFAPEVIDSYELKDNIVDNRVIKNDEAFNLKSIKAEILDITGYIKNSDGSVKIDDSLIINNNLDIQGFIKNSVGDLKVYDNIDMYNKKIKNVSYPSNNADVANKKYVDDQINTILTNLPSNYIKITDWQNVIDLFTDANIRNSYLKYGYIHKTISLSKNVYALRFNSIPNYDEADDAGGCVVCVKGYFCFGVSQNAAYQDFDINSSPSIVNFSTGMDGLIKYYMIDNNVFKVKSTRITKDGDYSHRQIFFDPALVTELGYNDSNDSKSPYIRGIMFYSEGPDNTSDDNWAVKSNKFTYIPKGKILDVYGWFISGRGGGHIRCKLEAMYLEP